jgi:hypothetical protein
LTIGKFTQFCQSLRDSQGQQFIAAAPASTEGGTIVCVASDNTQESLVSLQQKQDMQGAVQAVCESTYGDQVKGAKNVLARLFNYRDPLSWQCFTNEQHLRVNITQATLNSYCQSQYPDSIATLPKDQVSTTAYDWTCTSDSIPYRISMDLACQYLSGNLNAIGLLNPQNFSNPNGWQCWGPS